MKSKNINPCVFLARSAVEFFIKEGKRIDPPASLPKDFFEKKSGVFVTLETQDKKLRGCIGTYLPTEKNIAEEIISNAISAATKDYRFGEVKESELEKLCYTVSILMEPIQAKSLDELDVKKLGVIVKTKDGRSGLLLPDIESVDTAEKQVSIAAQKGGIDLTTDEIFLYKFRVKKHGEKD
ncbi:MAG: AMMECR1 protein [uncultured bacterium]|nr:MAG: AMMECR1 protein [uncultured bacterium]